MKFHIYIQIFPCLYFVDPAFTSASGSELAVYHGLQNEVQLYGPEILCEI